MATEETNIDVLVVGAGVSGISTAFHLKHKCKKAKPTFVVLERRANVGGTWDLFQYPGVRSDSDMYSYAFSWFPWTSSSVLASADRIKRYLKGAINENDLRQHIKFGVNVVSASYSSATCLWTVRTTTGSESHTYRCRFVVMNTGYFRYDPPYSPDFQNQDKFKGEVLHAQRWPTPDQKQPGEGHPGGCNIVVIGSGATAYTLIPNLAKRPDVAKVTMLQRSPTYIKIIEGENDPLATFLHRWFGSTVAFKVVRWRNIVKLQMGFMLSRRFPKAAAKALIDEAQEACPDDFNVALHCTPTYKVWDQRVCVVPDGDFYESLRQGVADIVTADIIEFEEHGIRVRPKHATNQAKLNNANINTKPEKETTAETELLPADLVILATGFTLQHNLPMSDIDVDVDGKPYEAPNHFFYRGCMISDVPNLFFTLGYSNASWTLKSDLVSQHLCDILDHCENNDYHELCARPPPEGIPEDDDNALALTSGYLARMEGRMPKLGLHQPWRVDQNVLMDYWRFGFQSYGPELKFKRNVANVGGLSHKL
eukprot:m.230217 g.230217  ORF g.230217 m.230217 type:complete len:538 (-) comp33574_c0_seq1:303-1916(-)